MAKERTTISGYVVSIEAFVPCDPRDPHTMVNAMASISAACGQFRECLPADAVVEAHAPDWRERRRPAQGEIEIPKAPSEQ
jgi:hypothetical protein